jgi:transcriptional regulator with XRE-family HTH domain
MERAGLNQKQLAELMEVNESQVSRWLDGSRTPRPDKAIKLAKLLKVSLEAIFFGK